MPDVFGFGVLDEDLNFLFDQFAEGRGAVILYDLGLELDFSD